MNVRKCIPAVDLAEFRRTIALPGFDVNARQDGVTGWALLHDVCGEHDDAVRPHMPAFVRALVEAGADVNRVTGPGQAGCASSTPLHIAAQFDSVLCVAPLAEAGASLEVRNAFGKTVLHVAASSAATSVIEALLVAGADARATADVLRTGEMLEVATILCRLPLEMQPWEPAGESLERLGRVEPSLAVLAKHGVRPSAAELAGMRQKMPRVRQLLEERERNGGGGEPGDCAPM
jgi:hypothetical protein